jgi:hypothetical protein
MSNSGENFDVIWDLFWDEGKPRLQGVLVWDDDSPMFTLVFESSTAKKRPVTLKHDGFRTYLLLTLLAILTGESSKNRGLSKAFS